MSSFNSQRRRQGFGASSNRSTFGYWVPLALTVTAATVGLAAWIWSERSEDEERDHDRKGDGRPPPVHRDVSAGQAPFPPGSTPRADDPSSEDPSVIARMSSALRRTPSPQQLFDGASRRVAAGVAAAGAVVGGALSSIREEDKGDFEDHSRWNEEAEARIGSVPGSGPRPTGNTGIAHEPELSQRQLPRGQRTGNKRKAVAIVVSAEISNHGEHNEDVAYIQEHASILSHLPEHIDADSRVFVLIYAPDLKQHPLAANSHQTRPVASVASSYSNIEHDDVHTPGEEADKPLSTIDHRSLSGPGSKMFNALYSEAKGLVEKETMIMPFTTPAGYVSQLRIIAPEVVYVQSTLSGSDGEFVKPIADWVGQVVLVVGDDSGHGGLVDSEDERGAHGAPEREEWWLDDPKIGLGKGIEVVDGLRIGEDWRRRVRGHD